MAAAFNEMQYGFQDNPGVLAQDNLNPDIMAEIAEVIPPEEYLNFDIPNLDLLTLASLDDNFTGFAQNLSWLLNISRSIDINLINKFHRNRKLDDVAYYSLIVAYSLLIIVGSTGNSLVVVAVIRKPAMRTARNVFIINLAISDLLLCLVTMPLTLVEVLSQYWPLGDVPFLCKLVGTLQATSIFVSTISITAIALDRYQVIVYPTKESLQTLGAVATLLGIWKFSFILALPNFIWRTLSHYVLKLPNLYSVNFCYEEWPIKHGRGYYSFFVMVVQYCLPIVTVSIAYARIYRKLKYRMANTSIKKNQKEDRRMKKTNTLLMSIALIFCLSWLPFNVYNLVVDFYNPFGEDTETMHIAYAICHMMGMSSACSNPLLYGWLNDNFRKEFIEIGNLIFPCCPMPPPVKDRIRVRNASVVSHEANHSRVTTREKEDHPVVLYRKEDKTSNNGNCTSTTEVTYIKQIVTNATL
ncbi:neuropeptide F receptor-like [Oratosquilla oratoria]|uniref:neuropeptide F receptor-like n=1 Tax=Oratosquilla oratoria TaxID=337810 RepID=UPI003F757B69